MTDDVSAPLAKIETALERLDRKVLLRALQPGRTVESVRATLASVELASASDVEALFGWRDGTSTDGGVTLDDIHIFPGFYLLSLEDAIANYRAFVTDSRWTPGWLPLFANGGGDFYVLDLTEAEARRVRHFWIDEAEHPVEFSSLAAMLETLAAAFERGIFYVDPNGYLEMDDLVFGGLATEINPDVAYWRELA